LCVQNLISMQINQLIIAMPLRPVAAGAYRADHSMH